MIHVLNDIYVALAVILLFGAAVFVHEFGHFWVARRRGLKVEGFSIGFGPKIFGWTRDGIDYAWRWIPAGGFVKLPQMLTSEALEGSSENPGEKLPPISPLSKILVSVAGPCMNVIFAFAIATLLYFTGIPVSINPSYIGDVETNSPEAAMGIQAGDRIVAVDGQPVTSWDDVQKYTIFARTNVIPVVIEHEGVSKTYQLTANTTNVTGMKLLNLDPRDHAQVADVKAGGAAAAAGMRAGDEIISVDNVPVYGEKKFIEMIQARSNKATTIGVLRDKEKKTITVTPAENPDTHKGFINAGITESANLHYQLQRPGPSPWAQISDNVQMTVGTFAALLHSKQTGVGAKDLSGPVGIFAMLAGWVNADYRLALKFLVLLNINLAMINLLPLPVLDGGHIAMSILEWIRRKPLNIKFVEYATMVFAVLLISFILYVTKSDIGRLGLFRSMFSSKVVIEQPGTNGDTVSGK
jgi:regulator of sigma E protease